MKETTNLEMDLRFEATQHNEYAENTKNDIGFKVLKIYWNFTGNVMTEIGSMEYLLEKLQKLKIRNLNTEKIAENIIQNFLRHAVRDGFFHADMHQETYL